MAKFAGLIQGPLQLHCQVPIIFLVVLRVGGTVRVQQRVTHFWYYTTRLYTVEELDSELPSLAA